MIYFRDNGVEREKYEITFDRDRLEELKRRVTKKCGELSIIKKECKYGYIPHNDSFHGYRDEVRHYTDDVHYKVSGNKATEWDHYDEYEVDLYNCEYKDYICPPLVTFIEMLEYGDKSVINTLFTKDFRGVITFPKVKEKIKQLQEMISKTSSSYNRRRKKKVAELNQKYQELNEKPFDVEKQMVGLQKWVSQSQKDLLIMDQEYARKVKELNDQLKYLLSIEKLNEHQEDIDGYLVELLSLVQIELIDKLSLSEINRVVEFSKEERTISSYQYIK